MAYGGVGSVGGGMGPGIGYYIKITGVPGVMTESQIKDFLYGIAVEKNVRELG